MFVFSGCGTVDKMVKKDIPIQDTDKLQETYVGRTAWTRSLLIDLGPEGVIDRDIKVKIISLDLHWNGAITVEGPGRRRIRHGLEIERPLTMQSVEQKLNRLFWFHNPEYRYRMNLRKYGKKAAKAIFEHQLFKGMKRDAALESWGYPDEMNSIDLGGNSRSSGSTGTCVRKRRSDTSTSSTGTVGRESAAHPAFGISAKPGAHHHRRL